MLYLIKYGELALKKQNRPYFERTLIDNIVNRFGNDAKILKESGRIYVETELEKEVVIERFKKIFGIVGICPTRKVTSSIDDIKSAAAELAYEAYSKGYRTFKVETRRPNKTFDMKSPDVNADVGEYILNKVQELSVDVHKPDFVLNIEVRDYTYLYYEEVHGIGGLPAGTSGRACLLLSGGIDSPVAGWMTMKRGVDIVGVHFHSFPFTSDRAKEKVIELTKILSKYAASSIKLYVVHFTDIQKELYENCPPKMITILMRRMMMRIADKIAQKEGALALVTGESIGQVASQTIESIYATNEVTGLPVFRPLIGMDKSEIIDIARRINTYETSVLPYEDCCTVFVPKHPVIKPDLEQIHRAEMVLNIDDMIDKALEKSEVLEV